MIPAIIAVAAALTAIVNQYLAIRAASRAMGYALAAKLAAERAEGHASAMRIQRNVESVDKFLADPSSGNLMKRPPKFPPSPQPPIRPLWTGEAPE